MTKYSNAQATVGVSTRLPVLAAETLGQHSSVSGALCELVYQHLRQGPWADRFAKLDAMVQQDPSLYSAKLAEMLEQVRMPIPAPIIQWHRRTGKFENR